jgi:hypothetical protein
MPHSILSSIPSAWLKPSGISSRQLEIVSGREERNVVTTTDNTLDMFNPTGIHGGYSLVDFLGGTINK